MTLWLPAPLLDHLWQSTLFVLIVYLTTMALARNAARVRFWFWVAASVKFLVPLSVLVGVGERLRWRDAPEALQPVASFVMQDVLAPATPIEVVISAPLSIPQSTSVLPLALIAVWAAGAAAVLMWWWRQWLPVRSALKRARTLQLDEEHGADRLEMLSSATMPEPGVVGVWRPKLLFPEGIVERLTPAQLRALIVHERCHVRYRDNLTAGIHMVVEAIFWFHPAVWWIERRLVDERERACDEAVLQAGSQPQDYAEGILEVCRQSVRAPLTCVAGVSGSNLRARIEGIMRSEIGRPMTRTRRWAMAVAIAVLVCGPIGGAAIARQSYVVESAQLAFETISVSQATPHRGVSSIELAIGTAAIKSQMSMPRNAESLRVEGTLNAMIQAAYGVSAFQVEGGPSWVREDRYRIEARPTGGSQPAQTRMLQAALADRFMLALRRETRTVGVYELVIADGGLKVSAMKPGECTARGAVRWDLVDLEAPLFVCDSFRRRVLSQSPETRPRPRWPRVYRIEAGGVLMSGLIDHIADNVDRVIIDKTGFTAPFNLLLDFAPVAEPNAGFTYSGPTIFAAVQEQLGLRLAPAQGSVDVLTIDRVERPVVK